MSKINLMKNLKLVFGSLQIVANKKEISIERKLEEFDIICKPLMIYMRTQYTGRL